MNEGIKKALTVTGIVLGICIASIALLLSIGHFAKKKMAQVASEKLLKEVVRESVKEERRGNKSKSKSKNKKASKESVEEEVQEILDNMDEEDREVIEDTIYNHLSAEFVKEAIEYIKDGDIEGLEEAAEAELSEKEIKRLMKIYRKYME